MYSTQIKIVQTYTTFCFLVLNSYLSILSDLSVSFLGYCNAQLKQLKSCWDLNTNTPPGMWGGEGFHGFQLFHFLKKLGFTFTPCKDEQPLSYKELQEKQLKHFFKIGILPMQGWTATTRHEVTRKRNTKRLRHTGNLFRKNLQLKDVC